MTQQSTEIVALVGATRLKTKPGRIRRIASQIFWTSNRGVITPRAINLDLYKEQRRHPVKIIPSERWSHLTSEKRSSRGTANVRPRHQCLRSSNERIQVRAVPSALATARLRKPFGSNMAPLWPSRSGETRSGVRRSA
jgi:hypothetical protein